MHIKNKVLKTLIGNKLEPGIRIIFDPCPCKDSYSICTELCRLVKREKNITASINYSTFYQDNSKPNVLNIVITDETDIEYLEYIKDYNLVLLIVHELPIFRNYLEETASVICRLDHLNTSKCKSDNANTIHLLKHPLYRANSFSGVCYNMVKNIVNLYQTIDPLY